MGNGTRLRTSVHGDEFACGAQQESPKGGAVPTRCLAVRHADALQQITNYSKYCNMQLMTYTYAFFDLCHWKIWKSIKQLSKLEDTGNPMNPHGLLIAYAEAMVKPVVSEPWPFK